MEGTGLCLVVTRHLIELMGGRIGVDSTPGTGSCFWFELAGSETVSQNSGISTEAVERPSRVAGIQPQLTVLLVGDDLTSHELVRAQLLHRPEPPGFVLALSSIDTAQLRPHRAISPK